MDSQAPYFHLRESYWTQLEPLKSSNVADLHQLSVAVSWPHRLQDLEILLSLGQGVIAPDAIGRPLGSGMSFSYGNNATMIGMMMTHPKLQAGGLGRYILDEIESGLAGRRLRLNSTRSGLRLYMSAGFRETGNVVVLYQGMMKPQQDSVSGSNIRTAGLEDTAAIFALDRRVFGADRAAVLSRLLEISEARVIFEDEEITGFALCRPFGRGYVVGPMVAGSEVDAKSLVSSLAADYAGQFLRLDVDERHKDLGQLLNAMGLEKYDTVIPMTKGQAYGPENSPDHVYALASHTLG
jgi:GNAT superfamily N-acetyltransferase